MRIRTLAAVVLVALPVLSAAHDMWIVSGISGAEGKICARIGERFPGTVNAPTADRVTSFSLRTDSGTQPLSGTFQDKQFCAPAPPAQDGIVEMVVHPRLNKIDRKRFAEFVRGEGLQNIIRPPEDSDGSVSYLYSRYSKLVMGMPDKMLSEPMGHALEIIPISVTSAGPKNTTFRLRVLFRGKPLADAQVAAVHDGASGEAFSFPVVTRTDKAGNAELELGRPGLWYARLIYSIPADDPEFQWHHFFATLTFTVADPQAR